MPEGPRGLTLGRTFGPRAFDVLVIGGGLTFPLALWLAWNDASAAAVIGLSVPVVALLVNQAHFAASTVRLYTKPGAFASLPFLTMVLPLVTLVVLSACIMLAGNMGRHLWALALTWSPFHYAAQTFGLASMYCYRSGCGLSPRERTFLRWACLMPFFKAFLGAAGAGYGLGWLVPAAWIASHPVAGPLYQLAVSVLDVLVFAMPFALFVWMARRPAGGAMPVLSLLIMCSNAMWFTFFEYHDAFVWATVFHGVQYLGIVGVFHLRDRVGQSGNHRSGLFHVAVFYATCVALGYGLFQCWPYAYTWAGFGMVESMLMVIAVINIHHFIVDAFIWRLRRDPNYETVMADPAAAA